MKKRRGLPASVATIVLTVTLAGYLFFSHIPAEAQTPPTFPHTFFGNIAIAGEPARSGLIIEARIGNVNYAQSIIGGQATNRPTVDEAGGTYGVEREFRVCSDNPDTLDPVEGGVEGDAIEFFVLMGNSWFRADTSISPILFQERGLTRMDLSVPNTNTPFKSASPASSACGLAGSIPTPKPTARPPSGGGFVGSGDSGGGGGDDEPLRLTRTRTSTPTATLTRAPTPTLTPTPAPDSPESAQTSTPTPANTPTTTSTPLSSSGAGESEPTVRPAFASTETAVVVAKRRLSPKEIVMAGSLDKAASVIERSTAREAVGLFQDVPAQRVGAILNGVSVSKSTEIIQALNEKQLLEILPEMSPDALSQIPSARLLEKLPDIPADLLVADVPPKVSFRLNRPRSVQAPPDGVVFMVSNIEPFEWARLTGARGNREGVLGKFSRRMTDLVVRKKDFSEIPSGLPQLEEGRVFHSGFDLDVRDALPQDVVAGYVTFAIDKSWIRGNKIHKWSIQLNRFDRRVGTWVSSPARPVFEEDERIFFRAIVSEFSTFVVTGGKEAQKSVIDVTALIASPSLAVVNQPVVVSADVRNISNNEAVRVVNLWIDNTIEDSRTIVIEPENAAQLDFFVRKGQGAYEVRVERLYDDFVVVPRDEVALVDTTPTSLDSSDEEISASETPDAIPPLILPKPQDRSVGVLIAIVIGVIVASVTGIAFARVIRRRGY